MTQQFTPAQLEAWAGLDDRTFPLPNLARLVLEKEKEIARLRKFLSELEADCEAAYPPSHCAIKYAIRQAMKETSDE